MEKTKLSHQVGDRVLEEGGCQGSVFFFNIRTKALSSPRYSHTLDQMSSVSDRTVQIPPHMGS